MNIELIQKSLLCDFRNLLLARSSLSRVAIDGLYKELRHMDISQLTTENKSLTKALCSCYATAEGYTFLSGTKVPLNHDPALVRGLRQTLGFFSRLHANVTEEMKTTQLRDAATRLSTPASISWTSTEVSIMRSFIRHVLGPCPRIETLVPKHGPGAVATREKGFQKLYFSSTFQKLDDYLGWNSEFLFRLPNQPHLYLERVEPCTRVIAVPKDALTIRTISCEPLSMMFLQQGLMREMYRRMFRPRWEKHFPFVNQAIQQCRAQAGSSAAEWGREMQHCTIDLSSASDDVKIDHVLLLFPEDWANLLMTLRSDFANFEELGLQVNLETFAPMGAATCFPVESLVFGAITYCGLVIESKSKAPLSGDWGVVGDDITTFAYAYARTLLLLEAGGFHPNVSKCCGPDTLFRESCGGDFFEGVDVTYCRPRVLPNEKHLTATAPMVQLATELNTRGFRQTARLFASQTPGPVALGNGPGYGSPDLPWKVLGRIRWESPLQRFEQKTVAETPRPSMQLGAVDGWEPVFNWFTSGWHDDTSFSNRTQPKWCWLPIEASHARVCGYQPRVHARRASVGRRTI